ncbi:hypothetical protein PENSPDRAFT_645075 [Peniophora sp. CONT]|nr:hypothetical protein PENSPDRAFT_645075 [Peniophora sp. CONT]
MLYAESRSGSCWVIWPPLLGSVRGPVSADRVTALSHAPSRRHLPLLSLDLHTLFLFLTPFHGAYIRSPCPGSCSPIHSLPFPPTASDRVPTRIRLISHACAGLCNSKHPTGWPFSFFDNCSLVLEGGDEDQETQCRLTRFRLEV